MLKDRDDAGRCPIIVALERGAVDVAASLLDTLRPGALPDTFDGAWIKALRPLLALHGCTVQLQRFFTVDHPPLGAQQSTACVRAAIAGMGCRCAGTDPSRWLSTIRLLVETTPPIENICPIGNKAIHGTSTIRGMVEYAYGHLLSASPAQAALNRDAFVNVIAILRTNTTSSATSTCNRASIIDFNPRYVYRQ
jgi:hypothetical protein